MNVAHAMNDPVWILVRSSKENRRKARKMFWKQLEFTGLAAWGWTNIFVDLIRNLENKEWWGSIFGACWTAVRDQQIQPASEANFESTSTFKPANLSNAEEHLF